MPEANPIKCSYAEARPSRALRAEAARGGAVHRARNHRLVPGRNKLRPSRNLYCGNLDREGHNSLCPYAIQRTRQKMRQRVGQPQNHFSVPLCLRVLRVNRPEIQPVTPDTARQILTSRSDFETHQYHRRLPMPPLSILVSHPLTTPAFI